MTAAPIPEPVDAQVIEALFGPWRDVPVTQAHADFLTKQAISPAAALRAGIRSITDVRDLPEEFAYYGTKAVPGLIFPWTTVDGEQVMQLRPDEPIFYPENGETEDDARKYVFPKGSHCPLGVVNSIDEVPGDTLVLIEGTKQGIVAGHHLPDYPVYATPGCRGWFVDGSPTPDLWVVAGKNVVVIFDGDLATKAEVYAAGEALAEELKANGATSVLFAKVVVSASEKKRNAIDDILAKRKEEHRTTYLEGLIGNAKRLGGNGGIPRPKAKAASGGGNGGPPRPTVVADRPVIVINDDRFKVMNEILDTLSTRWNRDRLFVSGKLISLRTGTELTPLDKNEFAALVAEAALTGAEGKEGFSPCWPDPQTLGSCLTQKHWFAELDSIARAPFMRADGSICQDPGYDEASKTFLVLDESMQRLDIPDNPTQEQAVEALRYLLDEWLVDFWPSFPQAHDKANLLALIFTPFIRGLVPLVPMAVITGRQAGVGKNKVLDIFNIATTGGTAQPLPWNDKDDDETRKVITSAFSSGAEVLAFDEAHKIESASLSRAITSLTYSDRPLGKTMIGFWPNRVTWVALGNQVQVVGDMSRRIYSMFFSPNALNPEDRPASDFKIEDPLAWTMQHRPQVVSAILTVLRSWFTAGKPSGPAASFGSFETWTKIIAGVLHYVGVEGFLANLKEFRSETDNNRKYWAQHLIWLRGEFGDETFLAADVARAMREGKEGEIEPPPGRMDPTIKGYSRLIGGDYHTRQRQDFGGLWITPAGRTRTNTAIWCVRPSGEDYDERAPHDTSAPKTGPQFDGSAGSAGTAPTPYIGTDIYISPSHASDTHVSHDVGNADIYIPEPRVAAQETSGAPCGPCTETEGGFTVTAQTPWVADEEPAASPAAHLTPHAYVPTERDTRCPHCKGTKQLVPPAKLWLACPTCHPTTFTRS